MDFGGTNRDRNETWNWREGEYNLQQDSSLGELLHMFDEQTPIKDCALEDLDHQSSYLCDKTSSEEIMVDSMESSQQKRRRMLQFTLETDEVMDSELMDEGLSEHLEWNEQWNFNFSEGNCALNSEGLDQLSEEWLDECLVEGENNNNVSEEKMNMQIDSSDHSDASQLCNKQFETQPRMVQVNPNPFPKLTKGKKMLMSAQSKLSSSIVYPFALIKPSGGQGDLTLNEINQKIHAPPKSKLKHKVDCELGPHATSAFSGKPVVVRKKIRTEGGKGSITIMRTKG